MLGNAEIALISVPSFQSSQDLGELALHLYYSSFLPPSKCFSQPSCLHTQRVAKGAHAGAVIQRQEPPWRQGGAAWRNKEKRVKGNTVGGQRLS